MNIKDALFKLDALGGSSVLDKELKQAVKEVALVINEIRNLCSLSAADEVSSITPAVRSWVVGGMGHAFHRDHIAATVANLKARHNELTDALTDCQEQCPADPLESAGPLYTERRIIRGALSAAKAEYGATYFDKVEG